MGNSTVKENSGVDQQILHIQGAIEAILFVNERPVTLEQIKNALKTVNAAEIKKAISQLQKEHEERKSGMTITEIAGGYQMLSNNTYASYVRELYKTRHKSKLSKPALESLAIIAYKQPVTRHEIEIIRGVNSDGVVTHLVDKELIKIVGRKDVPGKPYLYGTTKQFMEYFGLKSLDDLPKLEEFPSLNPEYEKEEGAGAQNNDEPVIPENAIPENSLEKLKQSAIKKASPEEISEKEEQKNESN